MQNPSTLKQKIQIFTYLLTTPTFIHLYFSRPEKKMQKKKEKKKQKSEKKLNSTNIVIHLYFPK
jgi:hypothetical protein